MSNTTNLFFFFFFRFFEGPVEDQKAVPTATQMVLEVRRMLLAINVFKIKYVLKECCKGQVPDRLQKRKKHAATSVKEHLSSICDFLSFLQMDKWKLYGQGDNN